MNSIKIIYFQKTIAAYRSDYLGALKVRLNMPTKHTSKMPITDFRLLSDYVADLHSPQTAFCSIVSVPF